MDLAAASRWMTLLLHIRHRNTLKYSSKCGFQVKGQDSQRRVDRLATEVVNPLDNPNVNKPRALHTQLDSLAPRRRAKNNATNMLLLLAFHVKQARERDDRQKEQGQDLWQVLHIRYIRQIHGLLGFGTTRSFKKRIDGSKQCHIIET